MLSAKSKAGSTKLYPSPPPPAPAVTGVSSPPGSLGSLYLQEESAASVTGSSAQNPKSIAGYLIKSAPQPPHLKSGYCLFLLHTVGTEACTAPDHMSQHVSQACLQAKNSTTLHFTDNAIELSPWKSQSLRHSIYPAAQHPRNSSLAKFYSREN